MLNKIMQDKRVSQIHISDEERVFEGYCKATGYLIRVESNKPSFKGFLEDEDGEYTIEGLVKEFVVKEDSLENALKRVYEKLQVV